jgi:hypothetical protein
MGGGGGWDGMDSGRGYGGDRGGYGGGGMNNYRDDTGREHALRAQQERIAQVRYHAIRAPPPPTCWKMLPCLSSMGAVFRVQTVDVPSTTDATDGLMEAGKRKTGSPRSAAEEDSSAARRRGESALYICMH